MNVKELRIGNYVTNNVECFDIQAKDLIFLMAFDNEHYAEPIPLSEVWLVKFGFAPLSDEDRGLRSSVNSADELSWSFNENILRYQTKGSGFTRDYNIKYVHQLQNLYFALTGKELEVKS